MAGGDRKGCSGARGDKRAIDVQIIADGSGAGKSASAVVVRSFCNGASECGGAGDIAVSANDTEVGAGVSQADVDGVGHGDSTGGSHAGGADGSVAAGNGDWS